MSVSLGIMNSMAIKINRSGFALILSLLITSVMLAIGLSLLDVTLKQITLSTIVRESEVAFQVAAAGMNCIQNARVEETVAIEDSEDTFTSNCFQTTAAFNKNDSLSNNGSLAYEVGNMNWSIAAGDDRCVGLEMHVYDAALNSMVMNFPAQGITNQPCPEGSTCTIAFSRGYNRSCDDVANANIYVVQRELTAEF